MPNMHNMLKWQVLQQASQTAKGRGYVINYVLPLQIHHKKESCQSDLDMIQQQTT